jgi:hypothetical protein
MNISSRCPAGGRIVPTLIFGFITTVAAPELRAQSDDFNDGNDAGWTRYDPIGSHPSFPDIATFSFPSGGYRIQTATSPMPAAVGPGRAAALRNGTTYTDFFISVDVVDWKDDTRQAFGILARVQDIGLGTTDGYAFTYERGSGVSMTSGDSHITRIVNEGGPQLPTEPSAYHLDPAKDYRFTFTGRGPNLKGRIYELPNVETPILTITSSDSMYTSGVCGLITFDNSGGTGVTDATFDNYNAAVAASPKLSIAPYESGTIRLSWPGAATGFVLEYSYELPATSWTPVSGPIYAPFQAPFSSDDKFSFLADGFDTTFFRLRYAP